MPPLKPGPRVKLGANTNAFDANGRRKILVPTFFIHHCYTDFLRRSHELIQVQSVLAYEGQHRQISPEGKWES
ncbi:MAG: hypothetical protein PVS2B2_01890 [Candidatus Acidiferrum sp.]